MNVKQKRTRWSEQKRQQRANLSNGYVRQLLRKGTHLSAKHIPANLVDCERARLRLARQVRAN